MSPRKRRYLKNALFTLALLVVIAWVVPFFLNADRYRPLLKAGLEQSLHRKVTLGHISLHFFPHLGFTVDNVVVGEDPAFGLEPFIRVSSIDCNVLWRSLWHSHLYFGTLNLNNPSINIVRNSSGKWNIENLLLQSKARLKPSGRVSPAAPANLSIGIENARLNFKVGENKKPFAIVDTNAHLDFDYSSERFDFRLAGEPIRTDLEFPSPGLVALDGVWSPGGAPGHTLNATLRMQGAMLYDWIPLITGQNPELYGVVNSTFHLTGTLRKLTFLGDSRVTQLHRWEQLPSSNDLPCDVRFRGTFDRDDMGLLIRSMDLSFANSQVHLEGSITDVASTPNLDLVVAFERSRLQDLMQLGSRIFWAKTGWDLNGRLNGMVAIRGPWGGQHYDGFLNTHNVLLDTSSGNFPVSGLSVRIARSEVRSSPARVRLAPGVEVVVQGAVRHISSRSRRSRVSLHPAYRLTLRADAINLVRLVHFGSALGLVADNHLAAAGIGSLAMTLAGGAWPWTKPTISAQANIRSARLVIPGLSERVNIPRARIQIYGNQVVVNPFLAVMGTSVFSGWVMHHGGSPSPWDFNLKADKLSIEQAAQWFDGIGNHASKSFWSRFSDFRSLIGERSPSIHLSARVDARGQFATQLLTYRALSLHNLQANLIIRDRKFQVAKASFEAGGGHGSGHALVNLAKSPVQISGAVDIGGARIQALRQYLPPALNEIHGDYSASGTFAARGLTHSELARTLQGRAALRLEDVNLGTFDPVQILARRFGADPLAENSQQHFISTATAHLRVQSGKVILDDFPLELGGAAFHLNGSYSFDGSAALHVQADLRGLHPVSVSVAQHSTPAVSRLADLRLAGTLRKLEIIPSSQISQTQP